MTRITITTQAEINDQKKRIPFGLCELWLIEKLIHPQSSDGNGCGGIIKETKNVWVIDTTFEKGAGPVQPQGLWEYHSNFASESTAEKRIHNNKGRKSRSGLDKTQPVNPEK